MARTLTAPSPIDTLEEAFDLLQRCSASGWLRYLAGAAPLIVGLLFVWNEFSSTTVSGDDPMIASLLLVALLVWFYRCRQIFAEHLRANLGVSPVRAKRLSFSLACFEGTKLLAMPFAVISVFPLAWATTFYRSLTTFAGEGLSARDAAAKAWRASLGWQRENWLVLAILNLLGLVVFADVAVTVIVAPILVRIFTGYESAFTQRGTAALSIQLPIILALTWICFDPLLQAVYTVRAFQWESLRTGEDLLVRLKRLPLIVLTLLSILAFTGTSLRAAPTALSREALNQSIDQTLQSSDYNWRNPPTPVEAGKKDWFVDAVDRALALLQKSWKAIRDLWSDVLDWIDRLLRQTTPSIDKAQPGKPSAVRPIFYALAVLISALALVLIWKFGPRRKLLPLAIATAPPAIDLTNEGLLASDLPEDEWLQMAERYANSGDLRLALRALYLGTLALLNRRGLLTIHACKSNRDYEGELRRRGRDTGLSQIFRQNIRSFEQSWYGFHEVTSDQIQNFRDNLGRMRSHAS